MHYHHYYDYFVYQFKYPMKHCTRESPCFAVVKEHRVFRLHIITYLWEVSSSQLDAQSVAPHSYLQMQAPVYEADTVSMYYEGPSFIPVAEALHFIHTLTGLSQCRVQCSSHSSFHTALENG
jgi:hypothetical protein